MLIYTVAKSSQSCRLYASLYLSFCLSSIDSPYDNYALYGFAKRYNTLFRHPVSILEVRAYTLLEKTTENLIKPLILNQTLI
jgi:hypothetical protein